MNNESHQANVPLVSNLSTNTESSRSSVPKLSEIQNIALHAQPPTKPSSRESPLTNSLKRSDPFQFGSRYLEEEDDVFSWNAWDHVDPSKDALFVEYAAKQFAFQKENAASDWDRKRFNAEPHKWWDKFYGNNAANFFKDRKWLRQEFPILGLCTGITHEELMRQMAADAGVEIEDVRSKTENIDHDLPGPWNTVLEIGAGAGNTAFPLVKHNSNDQLMVHAVDFSKKAVEVMRSSELYDPSHITASQWDMAATELPEGLSPGSVDVIVLVFAFSALSPKQWEQTIHNVWTLLRPGGEVCFRDYGRGDLAQVRFKRGRWLGENFYVRGDGTRVYFFEEEELRQIWSGQVREAMKEVLQGEETEASTLEPPKAFEILKLGTDRRLLVNRQKQLKMYRCWMQGRFRKPFE
jgi:tRNAThr (cytosine32-N3)-methyltransferase